MAQHLTAFFRYGLLVSAASSALASAETLRDPTMPPAQFLSGTVTSPIPENRAMQLQSVSLSSTTKYALINGKTVMLGGQYNDEYRLIRLSANQAQLKAQDGTVQILYMDYNVEKNVLGSMATKSLRNHAKPKVVGH
jgi:hypothetical protein